MTNGCTYVGTLYAVQLEGQEPQPVERVALGVDDELGLVQADNRRELAAGRYLSPTKGTRPKRCVRLWYERTRKDYPGDRYWYHDLADTSAFFVSTLDNTQATDDRGLQVAPLVVLEGPDVEICAGIPGDFLCG